MHNLRFPLDPAWRMLAADLQLDFGAVLAHAGLPADLFARDDMSLALGEYLRLWQAMEQVLEDPAFPVALVPRLRHEGFDPALFAAFCSPDLATALQRLARFKALKGPLALDVHHSPSGLQIRLQMHGVDAASLPSSLVGTELVFFVHLARSGTGLQVRPLRVESPVALPDLGVYEAYFGAPVTRGAAMALVFAHEDARLPFVSRNELLWRHFEPALQQRLDRLKTQASMEDRVRACLLEQLPAGAPGMDEVARRLLIGRRTLQRRLGEEGQTFQAVVRALRADLAAHYLGRADLSIAQIGYLLGFDDPGSFSRTYRSWTGRAPEQTRALALRA